MGLPTGPSSSSLANPPSSLVFVRTCPLLLLLQRKAARERSRFGRVFFVFVFIAYEGTCVDHACAHSLFTLSELCFSVPVLGDVTTSWILI